MACDGVTAKKLWPPPERMLQRAFSGLVVYYWVMLEPAARWWKTGAGELGRGDPIYLALVLPIAAFVVFALPYAARLRYKPAAIGLVIYTLMAGILAFARADLSALSSLAVFAVPLIIVANSSLRLPPRLIMGLFWATLLWCVLSYYAGLTAYGFLPGQTSANLHMGLWWRISLFAHAGPLSSALFSLCVLYGTMILKWRVRFRRLAAAIAVYFLILSGIRSVLLAAGCIFSVAAIMRLFPRKARALSLLVFATTLCVGIGMTINPAILSRLSSDSAFLRSYAYREVSQQIPHSDETESLSRASIWGDYLALFRENPVIGVGTSAARDQGLTWSEAFFAFLLARDGLIAVLLLCALCVIFWRGIASMSYGRAFVAIVLLITGFFYSSYMVGYNLSYLLVLGMFHHQRVKKDGGPSTQVPDGKRHTAKAGAASTLSGNEQGEYEEGLCDAGPV